MKKVINVVVAVFIMSFVAAGLAQAHCGQCGKGSAKDGDWLTKKVEKMTENLGLSAEQATQIEGLIKEKVEKKKAIKEEKRKAIQAVKDEYSGKIKAVLTDEQKVKFDAMMEEKKAGKKGSDHDHKGSDHDHKGSGGEMGEE